jgi:hypothetical protein
MGLPLADCQSNLGGVVFAHMSLREYCRLFLKSALGLLLLFASLTCGVWLALALSSSPLPRLGIGLLSGLGCFGLLFALCLVSGLGPKTVAREAERLDGLKAKARLGDARDARERLAALRVASEKVSEARDLVALEAGRFIEEAERSALAGERGGGHPREAYDPRAIEALEEALSLVDAWQREADESSSERRFGSADAHVFPEAESRVVEALKRKASDLVSFRDRLAETPSAPDVLSIEEELRR